MDLIEKLDAEGVFYVRAKYTGDPLLGLGSKDEYIRVTPGKHSFLLTWRHPDGSETYKRVYSTDQVVSEYRKVLQERGK